MCEGEGGEGGWGSCDPTAPRPALQAGETQAHVGAPLTRHELFWFFSLLGEFDTALERWWRPFVRRPLWPRVGVGDDGGRLHPDPRQSAAARSASALSQRLDEDAGTRGGA